jgi:hypothetical protein
MAIVKMGGITHIEVGCENGSGKKEKRPANQLARSQFKVLWIQVIARSPRFSAFRCAF